MDISKRIPVIRVNWSEFRSTDEVAEYVLSAFKNMTRIIDVDFTKPVNNSEVNEPEWSFWIFRFLTFLWNDKRKKLQKFLDSFVDIAIITWHLLQLWFASLCINSVELEFIQFLV